MRPASSLPAVAWSDEPPASSPPKGRYGELIEQLGAPQFARREQATRELLDAGDAAYEQLLAASDHASLEVRSRAGAILRSTQLRVLTKSFHELARRPDAQIDVEYGMWLIARIYNPKVERAALKKPLDDLAERVRRRVGPETDLSRMPPDRVFETLRLVLYEEQRFGPNDADYTNPENSSLEFVLAKRRGLPIMMSHVMIGVAERLGWPLVGVPLPGRYIVRYDGARAPNGEAKDDLYFDAYTGKQLAFEDIQRMFGVIDRDSLAERPEPRQILVRMMNNLENHLLIRGRHAQAETVAVCRSILEGDEEDPFQ